MFINIESLGIPLSLLFSVAVLVALGILGLFLLKALERRVVVFVKNICRLFKEKYPRNICQNAENIALSNYEDNIEGLSGPGQPHAGYK